MAWERPCWVMEFRANNRAGGVAASSYVAGIVSVGSSAAVDAADGEALGSAGVVGMGWLADGEVGFEEAVSVEDQPGAVVVLGGEVEHPAAEEEWVSHLGAGSFDVLDDPGQSGGVEVVAGGGDEAGVVAAGQGAGGGDGVAVAGR